MRFFTPRWYRSYEPGYYRGEWYARSVNSVFLDYDAHLRQLEPVLPPPLLDLALLPGVDDGLIVEARWGEGRRYLLLTLRCGDHPTGYFDLELTYARAAMSPADEATLARLARATDYENGVYPEVAYHEIDRGPEGAILHGWLFHPGHTFTVRCAGLQWRRTDRPGRDLPLLLDRFPNGPATTLPVRTSRWQPHRTGLDRGRPQWQADAVPSPPSLRWEMRQKRAEVRDRANGGAGAVLTSGEDGPAA